MEADGSTNIQSAKDPPHYELEFSRIRRRIRIVRRWYNDVEWELSTARLRLRSGLQYHFERLLSLGGWVEFGGVERSLGSNQSIVNLTAEEALGGGIGGNFDMS